MDLKGPLDDSLTASTPPVDILHLLALSDIVVSLLFMVAGKFADISM